MSKLTQKQAATSLGLHKDAFSHLKRNSPKLYRWIRIFGKCNLHAGMSLYISESRNARVRLAEIYFELRECDLVKKFYDGNKENMAYKDYSSFRNTIKVTPFYTNKTVYLKYDFYRSMKKMIKLYDGWNGYNEEDKIKIKALYE